MLFAMLNPRLHLLKKFYFPIGLWGCEEAGRRGSAEIYVSQHENALHLKPNLLPQCHDQLLLHREPQIPTASTMSLSWDKVCCFRWQKAVVDVDRSQVLPLPQQEESGKGVGSQIGKTEQEEERERQQQRQEGFMPLSGPGKGWYFWVRECLEQHEKLRIAGGSAMQGEASLRARQRKVKDEAVGSQASAQLPWDSQAHRRLIAQATVQWGKREEDFWQQVLSCARNLPKKHISLQNLPLAGTRGSALSWSKFHLTITELASIRHLPALNLHRVYSGSPS